MSHALLDELHDSSRCAGHVPAPELPPDVWSASTADARPVEQDEDIGRRLAQGEIEGLEMLYDRYAGLALSLACRILEDRQSADEVVQESFLQIWRHATSYDPQKGRLRSWFLAILRRRCLDALRRRARLPRTVSLAADGSDHPGKTDTWKQVEQRLTRASLRSALLQLSAEQRQAIELGYLAGFSHPQIAERLGLPLGTVKGRLRLGLRHLRALLEAAPSVSEGNGRLTAIDGAAAGGASSRSARELSPSALS